MKAFNRLGLAFMALMIIAMLLVACGDSPTSAPAATTAAATATTAPKSTTVATTTAAATTAAPAPTTAAPTTAAPTTAPATTAAVTGNLPVPAGAKTLKLGPNLTQGLTSQFASTLGFSSGKVVVEAYSITQSPADLSTFYDAKLAELGYTSHPETQKAQQVGNVNLLTASFTRTAKTGGIEANSIVLLGPLDAAAISQIGGTGSASGTTDPDFAKQLNPGDTLILSFDFVLPAGATAPATTAAPAPTTAAAKPTTVASSTFPAPANGRLLSLSAVGDKAVFGDYGSNGLSTTGSALKITTYVVQGRADTLSMFYDQAMTTLGYAAHPESNTGDVKGTVSYIGQNYTKGAADTYIYFIGPLDQATIDYIAGQVTKSGATDDITKQMQVGDTIVRAYEGSLPASAVPTTAAAPTQAPAAIPLPSGATQLKLSAGMVALFQDEVSGSAKAPKLSAYVVNDDLDSLTSFFEKQLLGVGYTLVPDSQQKDTQDGVTILSAGFTKGSDLLTVTLFGPMDQASLTELINGDIDKSDPSTSLKSQVKVGDTIIFVVTGTK